MAGFVCLFQDVNDHAPSFGSQHYTSTVSEAIPIGTAILTVTAQDEDSKPNAAIHYHIQPNHLDGHLFHIDSNKGVILNKQRLDHEKQTELEFVVMATDSGVPALSSSVIVTVHVTDLNDNPPRFHQLTYRVRITDLVERGQFVTIVSASDEDSSDKGHLAFSIVGGNDKQTFVISDSTGIISLSSLRIPQLESNDQLNISVTDAVFTAFALVLITVHKSNNHAPMFPHLMYDVDLAENLPPGHVATVQATDADEGGYGTLEYEIDSIDALEYFSISKDTGEVRSMRPLDREQQSQYIVPVVARDGGGLAAYTQLRVNVADKPDSKPHFHMPQYKVNIYETTQLGVSILQVSIYLT